MSKKKVVIDLNQLDLLEKKIIKATELIRTLRRERTAVRAELEEATTSLAAVKKEAISGNRDRRELSEAVQQVEVLREEREAVRGKVQKMLDMMDYLDEAPSEARGEH